MQYQLSINQWESDFFQHQIGKLNFSEYNSADICSNMADFELIQAKVQADELEKIAFLQQQGFQLVEGEIDFRLPLQGKFDSEQIHAEIAQLADIPNLKQIFGEAFPHSRFRAPWFSSADNQRFYQTWIEKAVKGEFDHLCLILKQGEQIQGGISLRLSDKQARVGLLAVAPASQGQGVAGRLLQAAVQWAQAQQAENLWIATQISNLPAINLYQKLGAKTASTSYWFYKTA